MQIPLQYHTYIVKIYVFDSDHHWTSFWDQGYFWRTLDKEDCTIAHVLDVILFGHSP